MPNGIRAWNHSDATTTCGLALNFAHLSWDDARIDEGSPYLSYGV